MDVFVTFFLSGKDEGLIVANGFSFVRHLFPGAVDVFIEDGESAESVAKKLDIQGATRFFCSVSWHSQLATVEAFADERWVIGGPYSHFIKHSGVQKPFVVCCDSFEKWAGVELDGTFTAYFAPLVEMIKPKSVYYNLAVGSGCYWKGCTFCTYNHIREEEYRRPCVREIIETFPMIDKVFNRANLGYAAVPQDVLAEVLDAKKRPGLQLKFFLRGDVEIFEVLRRAEGMAARGLVPGLGLESPSQTIVNRLNKNINLNVVLLIAERVLALGGSIRFNLMDHYPFATMACVDESRMFLASLTAIHKKYGSRRMVIDNAGATWWYSKASLKGCECTIKEVPVSEFRTAYKAVLAPDSEAFRANREISKMIIESGIPIVGSAGANFISLRGAE
jgi:hypothetical protein